MNRVFKNTLNHRSCRRERARGSALSPSAASWTPAGRDSCGGGCGGGLLIPPLTNEWEKTDKSKFATGGLGKIMWEDKVRTGCTHACTRMHVRAQARARAHTHTHIRWMNLNSNLVGELPRRGTISVQGKGAEDHLARARHMRSIAYSSALTTCVCMLFVFLRACARVRVCTYACTHI